MDDVCYAKCLYIVQEGVECKSFVGCDDVDIKRFTGGNNTQVREDTITRHTLNGGKTINKMTR